jgi:hypothetical protein
MDDIKGLTPHASRVNGTVPVATIPWRFTYLCWNIPKDHEGHRQRKQFADHNEAALFSSEKHTELLNRGSSHRNISTILSEPDIREAESCITRLGGKYKLAEAVDFFLKHFNEPNFKITVSEASVKFRASLEGRVRDRTLVQRVFEKS